MIQGLEYYKSADDDAFVPGLMHVRFGDYHISDVEVVAAFEVNKLKIGKDVAEAIWEHPNVARKFADGLDEVLVVQFTLKTSSKNLAAASYTSSRSCTRVKPLSPVFITS